MSNPEHFPWGEFLEARAKLIDWFIADGRDPVEIANTLSMESIQVQLIAMREQNPSPEFMRGAQWAKAQIAESTQREVAQLLAVITQQFGTDGTMVVERYRLMNMPTNATLTRRDDPQTHDIIFHLDIPRLDS